MPRSKPKIQHRVTSTKPILKESEQLRLTEALSDEGYEEDRARCVVRGANSAAVSAYILSKQFPTIGQEVAWYRSVLKKLDRFDTEGLESLFEQADHSDRTEIAEIGSRIRKLRERYAARIKRLGDLNKRARPEGRSVLAEELVWHWNVHFDEMPKYPPENRAGRVAPFLVLLSEVIQIAEGLTPDDISIDSLRVLTSEAIAICRKRVAQESQFSA